MKVLVTGGVRSGKSAHAESLFGEQAVTYVAPGPVSDDADWAARIAAHRDRRPAAWTTVETSDLVAALAADGPVLIDCLGTWLSRLLDEDDLWDAPPAEALSMVESQLQQVTSALRTRVLTTVLVTNEVGLGGIAGHRSSRLFADLLGTVNQRIAHACDEVHLVIAGRVLVL